MTRQNSITHHSPLTIHYSPAGQRRGVLLLVVLILLVMFVMMAVTYVLVATRQLSISKAMGLKDATGDPPVQVLDGVMMQLVRDTPNKHSVLYSQSLLEHMYGPYGFTGTVNVVDPGGNATRTAADANSDQIVEFTAAANPAPVDGSYYSQNSTDMNTWANFKTNQLETDGYLNGCVITMTSGPAKGLSSRIVRYDATIATNPVFHVLAFKGANGSIAPQLGDTFLINGRAFSGTGIGLGDLTLDAIDGNSRSFALLPNSVFYTPSGDYAPSPSYPNGFPFGGLGGSNPDYDAPDYQHMFMSWSVIGASGLPQTILPSFHRPDLINYWNASAGLTSNPSLLEKVMLRPMGAMKINGVAVSNPDHPQFTGSNPNFDAINGPWDVDNDGDGVPDSVWIDAGYPVQMRADGKLYKPLVAILCVDLDGRLNVNAAGTTEMLPPSSAFTQSTHSEQFVGAAYSGSPTPSGGLPYFPGAFAGTDVNNANPQRSQAFSLPRGEGLGPTENDLFQFYTGFLQQHGVSQSLAISEANQDAGYLLQGGTIGSTKYDGRYGDSTLGVAPQAGVPLPNQPTLLGEVMRFQYPRNNYDPTTNNISPLSSFGSPSDLWGRMAVGLDYRGQPLFWKPALAGSIGWAGELKNDPYDMNLSIGGSYQTYGSVSADNPFSVFDLERMLRPFDVESGELPQRLWQLAGGNLVTNPTVLGLTNQQAQSALIALGHATTTDSWDVPTPSTIAPNPSSANSLRNSLSKLYGRSFATNVVEMLSARLVNDNPTWALDTPSVRQAKINANIRLLLSPELIAGLRMNINRPLGDGRDGDNNGVVDEPTTSEIGTEGNNTAVNQWSWLSSSLASVMPPPPKIDLVNGTDVNGDGKVDQTDQLLARQLLARHLYVLARLMLDDDFLVSANNHWFDNEPTIASDTAPYGVKYQMSVRRIAQWAINVVDFVDPDNIMTPFEYDINPFKSDSGGNLTWEVDGIISDANVTSIDDAAAWRGLVWGCERPELLLNETIAFHDLREVDSSFDNGVKTKTDDMTNPDPTLDQARIPQGSAFFELYCTGNVNQPQQSGDLYDSSTGQWMLDLGKMAPPDNLHNVPSYPIWRLAITGSGLNTGTHLENNVQSQIDKYPETYSFDTANASASLSSAVTITPPSIERVVWFTENPPVASATYDGIAPNKIYYRRGGTALLGPGQYAVIGPRQVTRIGWTSRPSSKTLSTYAAPVNEPACSKIVLTPGYDGVLFTDEPANGGDALQPLINYPSTGTTIQKPLAIIAAADLADLSGGNAWDSGWSTSSPAAVLDTIDVTAQSWGRGVGISVSEPFPGSNYYQEPKVQRDVFDGEQKVTDCYGPLIQSDDGSGNRFLDMPEDRDPAANRPLKQDSAFFPGNYPRYKTVLLQRLANPLVPFDAKSNPYLTVDWMPIDLTVFNGQSTKADPDAPAGTPNIHFASRQHNGKLTGGATDFNVWYRATHPQQSITGKFVDDPPSTTANDSTGWMIFPHQLKYYFDPTNPSANNLADPANTGVGPNKTGLHTFGFVDSYFQQPLGVTFGQAGQTYGPLTIAEVNNDPKHVGDPRSPFPWLVWNNRPYQSVSELMMVPASHPGRLLNEFSMLASGPGTPYSADTVSTVSTATSVQLAPFGHLLNFFNSTPPGSTSPTGAGLSQMLEYLTVPSPFVGTQTVLNPQTFAWSLGTPGEQAMGGGEPNGTAGLHPPFNLVSNYREPGKVNINTITGEFDTTGKLNGAVWNAIIGGDPTAPGNVATGPSFRDVALSRQGYLPTGATLSNTTLDASAFYRFDSSHPSIFSNPFRSAAGADMVPQTTPTLAHSPTNVTLYRAGMDSNGRSVTDGIGTGMPYDADNAANQLPLMTNTLTMSPTAAAFENGTRNAYFAYQGLDHVTGKVTTHSNVYAVWITVGYFEVTPWYGVSAAGTPNTAGPQVFDTAHPDGYQLGAELGSDTGQVERHRAFYIIDRSIPVGYQHGLDNNVNNAVLLKRFIE